MSRFVLAALALSLAAPAGAINMNAFKDAPITRLSKEEVKLYRAAVVKALDTEPDGATVEWKAPTTQFVAKITPQRSFADGAAKCREATIEADARDRFQRGLYTFCRDAKGDWRLRPPEAQTRSR